MVMDLPIHVGDVTDRLKDLSGSVSDLPAHVGDVTDRLRDLSESAAASARRVVPARQPKGLSGWALPLGLAVLGTGIGVAVLLWFRSRRSTTKLGSTTPSESFAHT
jgi:hypothetical protein